MFLKFSDGSNLQVNVKVGSSYNANATGFGYTISVSGCP
jgi:hypothetical protein